MDILLLEIFDFLNFDLFLVFLSFPLITPIYLLVMLLVLINFNFPILFKQPRGGLNGKIFNQGILNRKELIGHYNYETSMHKRIVGFEYGLDSYRSFNIYDINGDILFESIFNGENIIKERSSYSIFLFDEWMLKNNNEIAFGLRLTDDKKISTSLMYLMKGQNKFFGRTEYMTGVIFEGKQNIEGKIVPVLITSYNQNNLFGEIKLNKNIKAA